MAASKILVIGSINMDLVLRVPYIPQVGETLLGSSVERVPGGKGANQAVTAAKLGADVSMLGKVGGDEFGGPLMDNLRQAGVNTDYIDLVSAASSGLAVIQVNDEGDNSIVVMPGANDLCHRDYVAAHESLIKEADIVILQMEIPYEAVYEAVDLASKHSKTIILNPAPAPDSIPDEVLGKLDYLIPNETELEKLSGQTVNSIASAENAAKVLLAKGVSSLIVTLGINGSLYVDVNETFHVPARVVKAVDTTAAGDSFVAAFAVSLSEGKSVQEAISFATKVSSIVVTKAGAQTSIPERSEVDHLL
ncbi:ribokinase [Paenibacillus woosongensis]|uniref:Ribokinase n=1 Tax=Paenibacillus woosongensis TaxID=307580 RepID=A0A7X3CLJ7_9BACL|nr:ribokinase [Paenibacillus woosongensis]MUG43694.1 ribokinase [Paenibacillus woosongensis]